MYSRQILLAGLIILAIFSACKSPVYVQKADDVDLNNYKTYMWVVTKKSENDPSARASAYADISVRNHVNNALRSVGWKEVNENPDALVTYDILVERSVEQKSDPVYTRPFTRYFYNPYTRRWSALYYPSEFIGYDTYEVPVKEGTITVTIIDAKTDKNVWQGWTVEDMGYSRFTDVEIGRSITNIFRKFDDALAAK